MISGDGHRDERILIQVPEPVSSRPRCDDVVHGIQYYGFINRQRVTAIIEKLIPGNLGTSDQEFPILQT